MQSCRHSFKVMNIDSEKLDFEAHIMNAKDLSTHQIMPELQEIHSFKIEGRMKSEMYLANAVRSYRQLIDQRYESLDQIDQNLNAVSNRGFSTGGLAHRPAGSEISYEWNGYHRNWDFLGVVLELQEGRAIFQSKQALRVGDEMMVLTKSGQNLIWNCPETESLAGSSLDAIAPNQVVIWKQVPDFIHKYQVFAKGILN